MKTWRVGLVFGAVAALVAGCASGPSGVTATPTPTGPPSFEDAVNYCGTGPSPILHIQDSGDSLTIDGRGDGSQYGATVNMTKCILDELEMPDAVWSVMEQTRALDGRQSADWDDINASWSYHPDNGLDVVLIRG